MARKTYVEALASGSNVEALVSEPVGASATNAAATVGTASAQILAASPDALERTVVNDSANIVYLALGAGAAAVGSGIRLNANGGSWSSTRWTGAVQAIATAAGSNVTLSEVT